VDRGRAGGRTRGARGHTVAAEARVTELRVLEQESFAGGAAFRPAGAYVGDGVDGPQRHRCAKMRVVRTGRKGAARDEHYHDRP